MTKARPYVLSIAGFDPSGGAGVLADVKTCEANKVYGFGVASALTVQNDAEFMSVEWISADRIIEQAEALTRKFSVSAVKIGLIENMNVLAEVVQWLITTIPGVRIVWDPVLKASAGFSFHEQIEKAKMREVCARLFVVTPNLPEAEHIGDKGNAHDNARQLSAACHVFLKGGHSADALGKDILFTREGKEFSFRAKQHVAAGKHGSGCVLSSALAANLAKGYPLNRACLLAKQYTAHVLNSNNSLLGFHNTK